MLSHDLTVREMEILSRAPPPIGEIEHESIRLHEHAVLNVPVALADG